MSRGSPVARWWDIPPPLQVSYLAGVDPELLSIDLDPLPSGAPAVVQFRPVGTGPVADHVAVLLDELDRAALALYPAWLPGAEHLEGPQGHGVAAVRALATEAAARSSNFGPFLADLAERALRGGTGGRPRFAAEVRAAGLARVLAVAYGRDRAALLIHVPDGLTPAAEAALTRAAEWIAHRGRLTVWLAGAPLHTVDRIRSVPVTLPPHLTQLAVEAQHVDPAVSVAAPAATSHRCRRAGPHVSAAVRAARRDSLAETALERALAPHEWAHGRHWNHTYEWHLLGQLYRLDLFWPAAGLVVEVDGPEHRQPLRFADDHRRDVRLHLEGHIVLRFTNDEVCTDVGAVVEKLRQMLQQRRSVKEKSAHVDH